MDADDGDVPAVRNTGEWLPGVELIRLTVPTCLDQRMATALVGGITRSFRGLPFMLLVDARRFETMDQAGRQAILQSLGEPPVASAVAVVSASLLTHLAVTGFAMLGRGGPIRTFKLEEDALRWLSDRATSLHSAVGLHSLA